MKRALTFLSCLLIGQLCLPAQTLEEALAWSRQELESVQTELNTARDAILEEKLPLARQLREVRESILVQRESLRLLESKREGGSFELEGLKTRFNEEKDLGQYLENQVLRFRQSFEADLVTGERSMYAATLLGLDETHRNSTDLLERAGERWNFLETSLDRLDALLGGGRFETEAISKEGVLEKGEAVQFGPLVFFKADQGVAAGNLLFNSGLRAEVQTLDAEHGDAVARLFKTGQASIRADPTLGQATLIYDDPVTLTQHLALGGFWMIPIGIFGTLALFISIIKWSSLKKVHVPTLAEFQKLKLLPFAEWKARYRGDTKSLLQKMVEAQGESSNLRAAELDVAYQEFRFGLNQWLPVVALTAGVSPLLGLLGTVTGMIKTFQLISVFGAGDAKLLSSGISEALITTEFGLVVAIPALVLHAYLQRRVKKILVQLAGLLEQVSQREGN